MDIDTPDTETSATEAVGEMTPNAPERVWPAWARPLLIGVFACWFALFVVVTVVRVLIFGIAGIEDILGMMAVGVVVGMLLRVGWIIGNRIF